MLTHIRSVANLDWRSGRKFPTHVPENVPPLVVSSLAKPAHPFHKNRTTLALKAWITHHDYATHLSYNATCLWFKTFRAINMKDKLLALLSVRHV